MLLIYYLKKKVIVTRVETCSGTENKGIDKVWDILDEYKKHSIVMVGFKKIEPNKMCLVSSKLNQFIKNDFFQEKGLLKNYKKLKQRSEIVK